MAAQSAVVVHFARQVPAAPQTYGSQDFVVPGAQMPAPSHIPGEVWVPAAHVLAPHEVPPAYLWQAPAPSQ